nr:hypothetical protein [uncultured Campylobacter sp.]
MKRVFSVVIVIGMASGALSAKGFDREDVSGVHSEENGVSIGIGVAFYDGMFRTKEAHSNDSDTGYLRKLWRILH